MKCHVPEKTKSKRLEKLADIQYNVVLKNNKKILNNDLQVVVDEIVDNIAICRSEYQAPFIDPVIYVENTNNLKPHTYYQIKVTEFIDYDLKGELKNE